MDIRPATLDDAHTIAEIHVAGWRAAYRGVMPQVFLANLSTEQREASWRAAIERGEPRILVAVELGSVVGWIAFGRCRDSDQSLDTGEISAVYANPEHWSRGVGRSLWLAARVAMLAAGFSRVTLWILAANERACRFYQVAGFTEDSCPHRSAEFGGIALDQVRLVAALAG